MEHIAKIFGSSLDKDDFEATRKILDPHCRYLYGDKILTGPDEIVASYKQNMIEGRKKLDELRWGENQVESINECSFLIHFTDYLKHKDQEFTYHCSQRIVINKSGLISEIIQIENEEESLQLERFYQSVGLAG